MAIKLLQDTANELGEGQYPRYMFNPVGNNLADVEYLTSGGEAGIWTAVLNGKDVVVRAPHPVSRGAINALKWRAEKVSSVSRCGRHTYHQSFHFCSGTKEVSSTTGKLSTLIS